MSSHQAHHSYGTSSTSSDSMMMLSMHDEDDDNDAVVYRERNVYDNDRGYGRGMPHRQGGAATGEGQLRRGRSWSIGDSRFLPSQSTQTSGAPSPGMNTTTMTSPPLLHHPHDSLPRHERKRRVKAIQEADRADADAQQAAATSPFMDDDMSPRPPSWLGGGDVLRHNLPGNPFAVLEDLVVSRQHDEELQQQQQQQQQQQLQQHRGHESQGSPHDHDDEAGDYDEKDIHRVLATTQALHGGEDGETDVAADRHDAREDDVVGSRRSSSLLLSGTVHPSSATQSRPRTSQHRRATEVDDNRRDGNDRHGTKRHREAEPEPPRRPDRRRNELSDSTNQSQSRSHSVERSSRHASGPARSVLDEPSSHSSILEYSRRQLAKAASRKPLLMHHASKGRGTGSTGTSGVTSTFPRPKAVVRPSSRSIVGSRPTHWGAAPQGGKGGNGRPDPATSLASFNKLQKARLADVLDRRPRPKPAASAAAAATHPPPPSEAAQRRVVSRPFHPPAAAASASTADPASVAPAELPPVPGNISSSLAPVSFAPSFLARAIPCVSATKEETHDADNDADDVVMVDFDSSSNHGPDGLGSTRPNSPHPAPGMGPTDRPLSPHPMSPAPTTTMRRKNFAARDPAGGVGGGSGTLVRRLKSLRDAVKADSIRMRSGQYGMGSSSAADRRGPSSLFIMNDPRTKAESYTDVTLVSHEPVACDTNHEKITYLAYCHDHHVKRTTRYGTGRLTEASDMTGRAVGQPSCSTEFVWLCVTFASARELDVATVKQLRIYNPIVVSTHSGDCDKSMDSSGTGTKVKFAVLSTYLCEPYPEGSPTLPEPPTLQQVIGEQGVET